ncbi:MAG: DUF1730 domain-containing protein, partial [Defluviitaleaceae bacterium]|nr:DUF1730 domain-containing protein [Defluviitaleaceae bacterium]
MNFKLIRDFAERNNIIAGACNAAPLEQTAQCTSPFVPFVSENYEKRTNPAATLKGVQSIIVIGVGCTDVPKKAAYAEFFRRTKCGTAVLSSLGTANDYHIKVKNLLRSLVSEMKIHADFKYKILVDSASLDERALALRAGLGFFGRNGLIISKKFGSRFNIGCLLTTLP